MNARWPATAEGVVSVEVRAWRQIPAADIFGRNNTPQAYPAARCGEAQTGGLLFPGAVMRYDKPALSIVGQAASGPPRDPAFTDEAHWQSLGKQQEMGLPTSWQRLAIWQEPCA